MGVYMAKPSANCYDTCGLGHALQALIGGYVIVELLGLPVDIFNLVMVKSENSVGIAQGITAPILNSLYMVINFIVMIVAAYFLILPQLSTGDLSNIG